MGTFKFLAAVILLVILIAWFSPPVCSRKTYLILTSKKEGFNPGFNPTYDRTFSQSMLDRQMDKMKDQKGYTADDYALGDLLYKRHSNN